MENSALKRLVPVGAFLVTALLGLMSYPVWKQPSTWIHERSHVLVGHDWLGHTYRYVNYTHPDPGVFWEPGLPEFPSVDLFLTSVAGPLSIAMMLALIAPIAFIVRRRSPTHSAAFAGLLAGLVVLNALLAFDNLWTAGSDGDHIRRMIGPAAWVTSAFVVALPIALAAWISMDTLRRNLRIAKAEHMDDSAPAS